MNPFLSFLMLCWAFSSVATAAPVVYPKIELKTEGQQFINDQNNEEEIQDSVLILKEFSGIHFKLHPANAYIPGDQFWSQALENKIKQDFPVFKVVSTEIQETASSNALESSKKLFDKYHPQIVIVALGENDGLYGKAVNDIKMYLSTVIQMAKNTDATVILVANQLPLHYGSRYVLEFKNMYTTLANEYEIPIVAQQQLQQPYPLFYPLHMEHLLKEQKMVDELIWPKVKKVLKKESA